MIETFRKRTNQLRELARSAAAAKRATKKPYSSQLLEILKLHTKTGRIGLSEYYDYELYDDGRFSGEQKEAFAGWRLQGVFDALTPHDWWGVVEDKVVLTTYLRGLELPAVAITAVFHAKREFGQIRSMATREDLHRFLFEEAVYPLFGKAVRRGHGIAAMSIMGRGGQDTLLLGNGQEIAFDEIYATIREFGGVGYLFQPLIRPLPATCTICGNRLTGLRLTAFITDSGPRILHASWKIPIGRSMVDNTSDGNLIGVIDHTTGVVKKVVKRSHQKTVEVEAHPDTNQTFSGVMIPGWDDATRLCVRAAATLSDVAIQGWDIALSDQGPLLVETNITGDIFAIQQMHRRGFLGEEARALLARRSGSRE